MTVSIFLWCYLLFINLTGFAVMGIDKKRAIRNAWRIPERSLFLVALLGGSLGCILGMEHFRHKTKHWYFHYGMRAIFLVETAALVFLYWKFTEILL